MSQSNYIVAKLGVDVILKYNHESDYKREIGARLTSARNARGLSRRTLCGLVNQRINIGRDMKTPYDLLELHEGTYRQWENGTNFVSLVYLPVLCEVLDCEVGYILCEYDKPHKDVADICKETSLSAAAVEKLQQSSEGHKIDSHCGFYYPGKLSELDMLSRLIENRNFWEALTTLSGATDPNFASMLLLAKTPAYINGVYDDSADSISSEAARATAINAASFLAAGSFTVAVKDVLEKTLRVGELDDYKVDETEEESDGTLEINQ